MGQFRHHHRGKTRTIALFWLRTSYHAQRYMFLRYMLHSLLTQSFNIVNTPIILLPPFSKKWVPGLAAEDNTSYLIPHRHWLHLRHFLTIIDGVDLHFRHESKLRMCRTRGLNPGGSGAR